MLFRSGLSSLSIEALGRASFASLPPAVLNFLVADRNKQDPELVASIVLLGNLSAMIFVPIGLYLGLK